MEKIESFDYSFNKVLKIPNLIFFSVVGLFFIALIVMSRLGGEFIPSLPEGDFAVDTRVLPGSNLKTSTDAVMKSQKILMKKFPEIEKIVGKTGSSEIPTDPMPIDASDMMIILKPRPNGLRHNLTKNFQKKCLPNSRKT
jgi:cobalt-zinc-cadmium resistance protein CzcA